MVLSFERNDEENRFYKRKVIESLIYSRNMREGMQNIRLMGIHENLYDYSLLTSMKQYLEEQKRDSWMTDILKQHAYTYLDIFRHVIKERIRDDYFKTYYDEVLQCVRLLNQIPVIHEVEQRDKEILKRYSVIDSVLGLSKHMDFDDIPSYHMNDLDLFYLLSQNISNSYFQAHVFDYLASDSFLSSIFVFACDCPKLFESWNAYIRMDRIIEYNRRLCKNEALPCFYPNEEMMHHKQALSQNLAFRHYNYEAQVLVRKMGMH